MPRVARVVVPDLPHHATQRGNNRHDVFFTDDDRRFYLDVLGRTAHAHRVSILAFCLMSNHVHLILVPPDADALDRVMGQSHWRHAQAINRLHGRSGHLWQGRYFSCPLDDEHLVAAMRYVERNPVRARMVPRAEEYPWSSAKLHCGDGPGVAPGLVDATTWSRRYPPETWRRLLRDPDDEALLDRIRGATRTGRPLATDSMLSKLEAKLNRRLRAMPCGRPRKQERGPGDSREVRVGGDRPLATGDGGTGCSLGKSV